MRCHGVCFREGEADGVFDLAIQHFIIPDQPCEDGESGRVGGCPVVGSQRVGVQTEYGAAGGFPMIAVDIGVVKFIQYIVVLIYRDDMSVARLDGGIQWYGIRAGVAFIAVIIVVAIAPEGDGNLLLAAAYDGEGYADDPAFVQAAAEVGFYACVGVDAEDLAAIGVDLGGGYVLAPGVVGGENGDVRHVGWLCGAGVGGVVLAGGGFFGAGGE